MVALKFVSGAGRVASTEILARELGLSVAQTHESLGNAIEAHLLVQLGVVAGQRGRPRRNIAPNKQALLELIAHGVRYVFVPERGKLARGVPTSTSAPPLRELLAAPAVQSVWPDARGSARGESFEPLHRCAVVGARGDAELYALLALTDAVRGGSARERELAVDLLSKKLSDD